MREFAIAVSCVFAGSVAAQSSLRAWGMSGFSTERQYPRDAGLVRKELLRATARLRDDALRRPDQGRASSGAS
ncbi:MAG: hypothetical protein WAT39_21945, partial [Planctomycetota bacterium]